MRFVMLWLRVVVLSSTALGLIVKVHENNTCSKETVTAVSSLGGAEDIHNSSKCSKENLQLLVTPRANGAVIQVLLENGTRCEDGPYSIKIEFSGSYRLCEAFKRNIYINDENRFRLSNGNYTYKVILLHDNGEELKQNSEQIFVNSTDDGGSRPGLSLYPNHVESKMKLLMDLQRDFEFSGNYTVTLYKADCKIDCNSSLESRCNKQAVCLGPDILVPQNTVEVTFGPLSPGYYCAEIKRNYTTEDEKECFNSHFWQPFYSDGKGLEAPPSITHESVPSSDNRHLLFLLLVVIIVPLMIAVCYYFEKGSPWTPEVLPPPDPTAVLDSSPRVSVLLLYLPGSGCFNERVDRFREILVKKMNCHVSDLWKDYNNTIQQDVEWINTKVNHCKVIHILSAKRYRNGANSMDYSNLYYIAVKAATDKSDPVMAVRFEDVTEALPDEPDRVYLLPKHFVKLWYDLHGVEPSEGSILERDIESFWGEGVFLSKQEEHNGECSTAPLMDESPL